MGSSITDWKPPCDSSSSFDAACGKRSSDLGCMQMSGRREVRSA